MAVARHQANEVTRPRIRTVPRIAAGEQRRTRRKVLACVFLPGPLVGTPGNRASITAALSFVRPAGGRGAQVAQLVEHCTENAGVGGSNPPLGTITFAECKRRRQIT